MSDGQSLKCELKYHIPAMVGRVVLGGVIVAFLGITVIEVSMIAFPAGAEAGTGAAK